MKVGIDVLEIERIKTNFHFLEKILTKNEIEYVNKFENKQERIAGIFCAKEAIFKALNLDFLNHQEIEINHGKNGRPFPAFYGKTKEYFLKNYKKIDISISHSKTIASAICAVE